MVIVKPNKTHEWLASAVVKASLRKSTQSFIPHVTS